MQRAASKINDTEIPEMELGGEYPVEDLISGEGGLLQVCMEGIGVLFADRKVNMLYFIIILNKYLFITRLLSIFGLIICLIYYF